LYAIKRVSLYNGRAEYFSRDTARVFFHATLDPDWVKGFDTIAEAKEKLETVKANYDRRTHTYMIIPLGFIPKKYPPLDDLHPYSNKDSFA
jgi:hypothetical protein